MISKKKKKKESKRNTCPGFFKPYLKEYEGGKVSDRLEWLRRLVMGYGVIYL